MKSHVLVHVYYNIRDYTYKSTGTLFHVYDCVHVHVQYTTCIFTCFVHVDAHIHFDNMYVHDIYMNKYMFITCAPT